MLTFLGLVIGKRLSANSGLWVKALAAVGVILIVVGAVLDRA